MYFIGLPPEVKAALDEMLAEFETEKNFSSICMQEREKYK